MVRLGIVLILVLGVANPNVAAEPVSFAHDVMAVLSKGGCNMGACHGNLNGKGGFKLSLRGEDPAWDFTSLTRGMLGRRVNPANPASSLILQKATARVPHEGGKRFALGDPEYQMLHDWIASGARADTKKLPVLTGLEVSPTRQILIDPKDRVQLQVTGRFADGSQHDLTRIAVYEPTTPGVVRITPGGRVERERLGEVVILVRYLETQVPVQLAFIPDRPPYQPAAPAKHPIDRLVDRQLQELRLTPSAVASDSMFVRRAYLDALGRLPTQQEAETFLAETASDKRARLVDTLLAQPEFAEFWAMKWSDLLRNEEKALDKKGTKIFHRWMQDWFASDQPLNQFAAALIAGRGSTYRSPPANFYRALRDPMTRAESVAQVFLGVRLACARCHNHPFDVWKQNEYHRFTAFFSQVQYRIVNNDRKDRLDKHEFAGDQVVYIDRKTPWKHPNTGKALAPKFLGESTPPLDVNSDRLGALADWVAGSDNPFFARAQVNRIWYHFFGRGLVEPNDDFRTSNPAVNAPLLDYLTEAFRTDGFRLKPTVRRIMTSQTYQRSSVANASNAGDEVHFSRGVARPLDAELLLDAMAQVLDTPVQFEHYPLGIRAVQLASVAFPARGRPRGPAEKFLKIFGQPDRLLSCDCERSRETGLIQAFQLITGDLQHQLLRQPNNRIGQLLEQGNPVPEILRTFYIWALSRPPTPVEANRLTAYVETHDHPRQALEDVVWSLLNTKEFLLRR